jgi:tryptophan-rich sensory protein
MDRNRQWIGLAGFIALCLLTGALGGWVTSQSVIEWYPTLNKPAWNPPAWIFAPVWTTLYVMMAVAAWLVWKEASRGSGVRLALVLFFVQLALNCLWSLLFFGARSPGWALVDIFALLAALAATTWVFFNQSRLAGALMLPYLAWVSFATVLNFTIWQLN